MQKRPRQLCRVAKRRYKNLPLINALGALVAGPPLAMFWSGAECAHTAKAVFSIRPEWKGS
jgi:hypothetical protein